MVVLQVTDASQSRYEVPLTTPPVTKKASSPQYNVSILDDHVFSFIVTRNDTGAEM